MTDSKKLTKTALITGASSGIGYELAKQLSENGFKVFACARRLDPMKELEKNYNVTIFKMDVADLESIENGARFIESELSSYNNKLDLLYNNAGQSCTFPALSVPDDALVSCISINFFGPVRVTKAFSKFVINAKGCIAFTGSIAGIAPFPWSSIYGSSKAAIHQYTNMLALELEPFDVRVLNVITGGVKTNIADTRDLPKDSIYNIPEMETAMNFRRKMSDNSNPMSAKIYCEKIIKEILYGNKNTINVYEGTYSFLIPFIVKWLPRWIVLSFFKPKFLLDSVFDALRLKYKDKDLTKLKTL